MSDDVTLQENAETLEPSQVEQTQEDAHEATDVVEDSSTQTELPQEAKEWMQLAGSTQERIVELVRRAKKAEELASSKTNQYEVPTRVQPPQQDSFEQEDVQKAINVLRSKGIATIEDVKSEIARIETNNIHEKLASKYNGKDGTPKYIQEEVEDYARRNQIWNLESAYRDMYFDELMDSARRQTKKKAVTTERPTASVSRDEPDTIDSIRSKLRNKDGSINMAEYEKLAADPAKLDALLRNAR